MRALVPQNQMRALAGELPDLVESVAGGVAGLLILDPIVQRPVGGTGVNSPKQYLFHRDWNVFHFKLFTV